MSMKKYAFIVDSSVAYVDEIANNPDIYKVCFDITDSENKTYEDNEKDITANEIIEKFSRGILFKTNAVSPGKVMVLLEDLINQYENIFVFTISSGLSSYYDNVKYFEEEPEFKGKVHIIDTSEIGYGITQIVLESKRMLDDNVSIEQVIDYAKNAYKKNFTMLSCESWTPLAKSGRAPSAIAKLLNIAKTKPIIQFYVKNKLGGVAKSFESTIKKIIATFDKAFNSPRGPKIASVVFYNNNIDNDHAEFARKTLSNSLEFPINNIIENTSPNLVLVYTANKSFGIHIRVK